MSPDLAEPLWLPFHSRRKLACDECHKSRWKVMTAGGGQVLCLDCYDRYLIERILGVE